jgi:hypothetical protein
MSHHRLTSLAALGTLAAFSVLPIGCNDGNEAPTGTSIASVQDRKTGNSDNGSGKENDRPRGSQELPATIELFAPEEGDRVGVEGVGWFIDIAIEFEDTNLRGTGFNGNQLTGPGGHNGIAPFPGTFGLGKDERLPGLVTLVSTLQLGAKGCQNISDTYNLTGVTNVTEDEIELWDTYIVGAAIYGRQTKSTLYLAEVDDLNHNGIFDDAPDVVPDVNHDGVCNETDLQALGLASEVVKAGFFIR